MKAFSFTTDKGQSQIGIEYKGAFYNFSLAWELYKNLKNKGQGPKLDFLQIMVEADFFHLETLQEVMFALQEVRPIDDLKLKDGYVFEPPVGRPQKILCIGRNYQEHAEELNNPVPDEPLFFSKSPSSLTAHDTPIRLPAGIGDVHFEGELAVVISRQGQNIPKSQALDHIAGFSLLNDVTAREMQRRDQQAGRPWFRSKSFDTFCPFGPVLVPKDAIHDFGALELKVSVNGDLRQQGAASRMLFGISELVSYLSRFCTLEPADIIATGTPSGVGPLQAGDRVEVEVAEIGKLCNQVVVS